MSQGQPRRPQAEQESMTYGDIFQVSGELASKPVAPRDAAAAQAAESIVLGQTQKGGPAAVMQSAADMNVRRGVLSSDDVTDATREHGVSISQDDIGGHRVITESVAGEVVGRYAVAGEEEPAAPPLSALNPISMTIGQALESVALSAGDKAVDESDAAAIQAVESRATGRNQVIPGGVASEAQSAAKHNARTMAEDRKIKLRDVLAGATSKLPDDRAVTKEDADAALGAEIRNKADMSTHPGGVAASMAAAARLNQQQQ
ncbi:UNVERIFIED_CONTAM: Late embryogenesis abundant protein D-34 [Sesamum angustifolium]|uniref:Late embryogenesis abundant protein D-34 n=1 Tax=Sesamum angustifolium TaxID=2727405 RepID=A0AAW2QU29_9LAMI